MLAPTRLVQRVSYTATMLLEVNVNGIPNALCFGRPLIPITCIAICTPRKLDLYETPTAIWTSDMHASLSLKRKLPNQTETDSMQMGIPWSAPPPRLFFLSPWLGSATRSTRFACPGGPAAAECSRRICTPGNDGTRTQSTHIHTYIHKKQKQKKKTIKAASTKKGKGESSFPNGQLFRKKEISGWPKTLIAGWRYPRSWRHFSSGATLRSWVATIFW